MREEVPRQRDRAFDRVRCGVEGYEGAIAAVIGLAAGMLYEDPSHGNVRPRDQVAVGIVADRL